MLSERQLAYVGGMATFVFAFHVAPWASRMGLGLLAARRIDGQQRVPAGRGTHGSRRNDAPNANALRSPCAAGAPPGPRSAKPVKVRATHSIPSGHSDIRRYGGAWAHICAEAGTHTYMYCLRAYTLLARSDARHDVARPHEAATRRITRMENEGRGTGNAARGGARTARPGRAGLAISLRPPPSRHGQSLRSPPAPRVRGCACVRATCGPTGGR
ncbi:hypothetical protein C8Q77DRAFT_369049 [Trametes polyzona]|nr:hypothetical protein C8Q77DRAFT_369049 [Trametes polyzona]